MAFSTIIGIHQLNILKEPCYGFVYYLNLQNHGITEIPEKVYLLYNLISLDLSYNRLEEVPDELFSLKKLKNLYLTHNSVTYFNPLFFRVSKVLLEFNYLSYGLTKDIINHDGLYLDSTSYNRFSINTLPHYTKYLVLYDRYKANFKNIPFNTKVIKIRNVNNKFKCSYGTKIILAIED